MHHEFWNNRLRRLVFNVWFTRSLASRLPIGAPLTVNVLNPGFCRSALSKGSSRRGMAWVFHQVQTYLLARSTEVGSRMLLYGALAGTQSEMQGRYLNACRVEEESDYAIGEEGSKVEERVWVRRFILRILPRCGTDIFAFLLPTKARDCRYPFTG